MRLLRMKEQIDTALGVVGLTNAVVDLRSWKSYYFDDEMRSMSVCGSFTEP